MNHNLAFFMGSLDRNDIGVDPCTIKLHGHKVGMADRHAETNGWLVITIRQPVADNIPDQIRAAHDFSNLRLFVITAVFSTLIAFYAA